MNIRDLEYFTAVAELKHFGRAAERCHISQPTLSGQIKKLEESLGVKLFERTNRKVMLTDAGKQILIYARRIMNEVHAIQEVAINSNDPLSGKFRLGAFPTLSTYIFPKILPVVKDIMPELKLTLVEEKTFVLVDKLKNGEIDAALLAMPYSDENFESEILFQDDFCLAVYEKHELAKSKVVNQQSLKNYKVLLLEEGHCLREQSLEVCHLNNISEDADFRATGLETLRQLVKAGTGITFMPKIAVQEHDPGITYLQFESPVPSRIIGLFWRKTTLRKKVIEKLAAVIKIQRGG